MKIFARSFFPIEFRSNHIAKTVPTTITQQFILQMGKFSFLHLYIWKKSYYIVKAPGPRKKNRVSHTKKKRFAPKFSSEMIIQCEHKFTFKWWEMGEQKKIRLSLQAYFVESCLILKEQVYFFYKEM